MEVKVTNVISMPREITNGKYNLYKFIIDKDIDAVVDGKLTKRNGFGLTEFAVRCYGIKINSIIGKTIDIDYEDIYDNIDDYEYPYNHVNHTDL